MKVLSILVGMILSTVVNASGLWNKFEGCYSAIEVDGIQVNQEDLAFSFKKSEAFMFVDENGNTLTTYSLMFEINESELVVVDILTEHGQHKDSGEFTEFSYSGIQYYRPQPEIPFEVETKTKLRMLNDSTLEIHYYNYYSALIGDFSEEYSLKATLKKVDSSRCSD